MGPYLVVEDVTRIARALESLLAARCSPNLQVQPPHRPFVALHKEGVPAIAVASNDQESAEDLLGHRADPNVASEGEEPPLCVAVRHRRRGIVGALLEHRADINIRSLSTTPPPLAWRPERGLTPLELAAGDERMMELLTDSRDTQDDVGASAFDI